MALVCTSRASSLRWRRWATLDDNALGRMDIAVLNAVPVRGGNTGRGTPMQKSASVMPLSFPDISIYGDCDGLACSNRDLAALDT